MEADELLVSCESAPSASAASRRGARLSDARLWSSYSSCFGKETTKSSSFLFAGGGGIVLSVWFPSECVCVVYVRERERESTRPPSKSRASQCWAERMKRWEGRSGRAPKRSIQLGWDSVVWLCSYKTDSLSCLVLSLSKASCVCVLVRHTDRPSGSCRTQWECQKSCRAAAFVIPKGAMYAVLTVRR